MHILELDKTCMKIFNILRAKIDEMKIRGISNVYKELSRNPAYFLYKTFSINPKYSTRRYKPLVEAEEKLLRAYIKQGDLILDAGCGDGRNGLKIVEELNLNPAGVVLFDINPSYLKKLGKFVRRSKNGCYFIMRGSIFDIGLKSDMFDVVICTGGVLSLAYGGSIDDGLMELRRVTKDRSMIIFSIITMERLIKTAEERGREDIKEEVMRTGIYPNWNEQYGEGICKGWYVDEVEDKMRHLGLEIIAKELVYLSYRDVPDSVLIVCRKKEEEYDQRMA